MSNPDPTIQQLQQEIDQLKAQLQQAHTRSNPPLFLNAVIDSLPQHIAIINQQGIIIAVNEAWRTFARQNGYRDQNFGLGENYIDIASRSTDAYGQMVGNSLKNIINSLYDRYTLEYPCHSLNDQRWFLLRLKGFDYGGERFVFIAHENISQTYDLKNQLEQEMSKRRVLDQAIDSTITLDEHGVIQSTSRSLNELLGYTSTQLIGKNISVIIPPPSQSTPDLYNTYFENELRSVVGHRREIIAFHQDGTPIPIEFTLNESELDGRFFFIGIIRDIAERKQIQNQLLQTQAQFQSIFQAMPDALVFADKRRLIRHANPALIRLFGYQQEELYGRSTKILYANPQDFEQQGKIRFNPQAHPIQALYEVTYRRNNGSVFVGETTGSKTVNTQGEIVGYFSIIRDVSQRKIVEAEIKNRVLEMNIINQIIFAGNKARGMAQLAQALIDTMLSTLDFDAGGLYLVNPDQITASIIYDKNLPETFVNQVRHVDTEKMPYRQVFKDGIPVIVNDYGNFAPQNAELAPLKALASIPIFAGQQVIGALNITSYRRNEITQVEKRIAQTIGQQIGTVIRRVQAEEALEQERQQLAQQVDERTQLANQQLSRAARLKDEFMANMSHELRTPLNAILGMTEVLTIEMYGPLTEKQLQSARHIEHAGRHLLELINDVLDLSKIEAGQLSLELSTISVSSICQTSLSFVKQMSLKKQVTLRARIDPHLTSMRADERRLKQILINLLTNAVKFTPQGGKIELNVAGDVEAEEITFEVRDTGVGIASEHLNRLFKPFVQIENSLSRQHEGTGLGLALVYQLVELHGGLISVQSEVNDGSRFIVRLPWRKEKPSRLGRSVTHPIPFTAPAPTQSANILLVEDNEVNAVVVREYLKSKGYEVQVAVNGRAALEVLQVETPDLILMDIQMPELDGIETTRRIRQQKRFQNTPIIALTALAMTHDREICLNAGMNEYLSKPVSLAKLNRTIVQLLDQPPGV